MKSCTAGYQDSGAYLSLKTFQKKKKFKYHSSKAKVFISLISRASDV